MISHMILGWGVIYMAPRLYYNGAMKKYTNLLSKILIMMMVVVFVSGCGVEGSCETESSDATQIVTAAFESSDAEPEKRIKIAVIDTGFSSRAISAESMIEGKNYLYPERTTEDTYGHGTAIASIILEHAPDVLLVPLVSNAYEDGHIHQVDNDTFGQMIRDAVDVYECDIINISAGLVLNKEAVEEAVAYAEERNVLIVASAGNDYALNGAVKYYPAAYDTVLAVGSLNVEGTAIADFSQRGEWVDAYVVGEQITIATLSGNTRTSDGTSYSAARITAAAAKYLQENGEMTPEELREKIREEVERTF